MKTTVLYAVLVLILLSSCRNANQTKENKMEDKLEQKASLNVKHGYAEVNGIKMYYEIYGEGKPLVLIHGGGSTIQTSFGRVIPLFGENRKVIAVEMQAHGRTNDRNEDSSFEQDADDVAALLKKLSFTKADFFGFSNGGTTAMQIAIRHPQLVNKLILGSALCKRNGVPTQFWDFMKHASLSNMPIELQEAYLAVAPSKHGLLVMHDRDAKRMLNFKDIPDEKIESIKASTFIIIGDKDVITPEHALEMHRKIANSELAIIPGLHGEYMGEITTLKSGSKQAEFVVPMLQNFLEK